VVWQSGKQSDRCLFHQDQNFGLVLLQVPVEIPVRGLMESGKGIDQYDPQTLQRPMAVKSVQ
jgi:hypothetical protein